MIKIEIKLQALKNPSEQELNDFAKFCSLAREKKIHFAELLASEFCKKCEETSGLITFIPTTIGVKSELSDFCCSDFQKKITEIALMNGMSFRFKK